MDHIGKYVFHKAAITSGYSRIFFCHDPDLQVPVAVKVFDPKKRDDGVLSPARLLARFTAEARALALFDHSNIIAVKTFEHLGDGRPFFVMPYMAAHLPYEIGKDFPGGDVPDDTPEHDRPRKLPLLRSLSLLRQVSGALSAMHRRSMVHRCLKPSNILLTMRENGSVKLADFSMVKLPERNLPLPGQWTGSTEYCAPEQREDPAGVTPAADVFSLGVLAFRLLSGRLPDLSAGAATLADAPPELATLVRAATDPDPSRRPQHAGDFLSLLEKFSARRPAPSPVQVVNVRKAHVVHS